MQSVPSAYRLHNLMVYDQAQMAAPTHELVEKLVSEARRDGMHKKGRVSIMDNNNTSYRVTPDKETVEQAGGPDEAEQWVDEDRGIVLLDLGGTLTEERDER